jgi:hypothetical protein
MTRPVAAAIILGVVALGYLLMWRGWRTRARRQADIPALPPKLPSAEVIVGPVEATYVGTTRSGDWLDRIVAHSLGRRGLAQVSVTAAGVSIARDGEPGVDIAAARLVEARVDRAAAGKVTRSEELVVVRWRHGEHELDTSLRPRRADDLEALQVAIDRIRTSETSGGKQ